MTTDGDRIHHLIGRHSGTIFKVFAIAWAFQALEEKSDRLKFTPFGTLDGLSDFLVIAAALAVVWRPDSMRRFGAFCFASILNFLIEIPQVPNHLYAVALINAGFLSHLAIDGGPGGREGSRHGQGVRERFGATVRVVTILLYALAGFHKLNSGFMDLELSCAPHIYARIGSMLGGFPPLEGSARSVTIYGAVLTEFGIPALLLARPTRKFGIGAGLLFHLFLGVRYPSFSTLAYALYVFFLPPALVSRWIEAGRRLPIVGSSSYWCVRIGVVGVALFLFLLHHFGNYRRHHLGWVLVFTVVVAAALVFLMRTRREDWRSPLPVGEPVFWPGWLVNGALVALLLGNGFAPYIGFKTETAFAMYSNLRTERTSNHLVIPKGSLQIIDWQDDLVWIRAATVQPYKQYATDGVALPLLELRRHLRDDVHAGVSGISMVLEHRGEEHASSAMETDPVYAAPLDNLFQRKLTLFRPVHPRDRCVW